MGCVGGWLQPHQTGLLQVQEPNLLMGIKAKIKNWLTDVFRLNHIVFSNQEILHKNLDSFDILKFLATPGLAPTRAL